MNLIFCSMMYSDDFMEQIKTHAIAKPQMAPHTFGKNLIEGFLCLDDVETFVINVPPMGSFPFSSKKLLMKNERWEKGRNFQPGYINLPIIKHKMIKRQVYKRLKSLTNGAEDTAILIYSLHDPFLDAAIRAKKKHPKVGIYLLQTDCVPGREDMARYMTAAAKRKGDRLVKKAKAIDGFVVLTKHLTEPLEVGDRPFCVVECVCNVAQEADPYIDNRRICLYTGSLAKEFGLFELIEAFKNINDAELWICGSGELENYLADVSRECKNIKYLGFVSQQQVAEIRKAANFLINPRRPSGTYTKHSFPSKTAEYMASGKPVIMYKLEGIPDEYDKYLNYLTEESPHNIAGELTEIFGMDYKMLCDKAQSGRAYIQENASSKSQASKIINMIKEDRYCEGFTG